MTFRLYSTKVKPFIGRLDDRNRNPTPVFVQPDLVCKSVVSNRFGNSKGHNHERSSFVFALEISTRCHRKNLKMVLLSFDRYLNIFKEGKLGAGSKKKTLHKNYIFCPNSHPQNTDFFPDFIELNVFGENQAYPFNCSPLCFIYVIYHEEQICGL